MERPIGIDLGTAYTRVAQFDGNTCTMICTIQSYVAFTDSGVLVGEDARNQALDNPSNTIFDVLRLIGRCYSDPSVDNGKRLWPFKLRASPDDGLLVEVRCKGKLLQFTPVEICSMLLIHIKENAEKTIGTTITDVVVTVPVCFNYEQRQAINEAGTIAGLNFLQIISSPAASALSYGMERLHKISMRVYTAATTFLGAEPQENNMVIFDLGAGTLDVALVTIKADVCRVRATAGDVHMGGSDIDSNMVDHFVNYLKKSGQKDVSNIPRAMSKLRMFCENAKIHLSSGCNKVPVKIMPIYDDVNLDYFITEAKFNGLNKDLFSKCINIISVCLRDANMGIGSVHEVILAGGATRIPSLQSNIINFFKGKAVTMGQNLEAATAYGAAMQAFYLSTWMDGRFRSLSLLDVIPFSFGLQSAQGEVSVFVPKNTTIPNKITRSLHFSNPNKTKFFFKVYEGEGTRTSQNNFLGILELSAAQFAPTGRDIDICFEVHRRGTLTVTVEEIFSGIRNSITITRINIGNCKRRVWEALGKKKCEMSTTTTKASMSKTSTRSDTSGKWDQTRERDTLSKLIIMEKERSEKIMEQSSKLYVEPEEYAIGIDFGTTYSSVAVWRRNGVQIIENEYGSRLTSSAVAFTDTGRLIGDTIHKDQVTTNPANTIPNIKRLIGKCYSKQLVENDSKFLPFKILCNNKNRPMISVQYKNEEKLFAPEEIAAMILSKMRELAEAHLNSMVKNAVISVPASFNDSQRKAIKDAGFIAGLNIMQLLNEPTAATIAYFSQKNSGESSREKILLIFDLGGGNLDVSIVAIREGIRVQAVAGDINLGGEDFDNNMVSHFVEKFKREKKKDISNNPRSLRRLRAACEKAKRVLSTNAQTTVEIDALVEGIDFRSVMTRKTFEEINGSLFKRGISFVERCLEDARMDRKSIDEVVLIGGSTRIPKMQQVIQEFFEGKELCKRMNADEAVVYGAAIQAAILSGKEDREKFNILELQDVTSLSFGLENKDGVTTNLLLPKHTPIPATKELMITNHTNGLSNFSIEVQECELESTMAFTLSGIPPKQRVKTKIKVYFEVDKSGILNLTAKETSGGDETEIRVKKENRGLTREEIEKMVETAARYKADDEEHKKRAAALNSLENFAYKLKVIAKEAGLPASDEKSVEKAADEAITWLETNHHAAIDKICAWQKKLERIDHKVRSDALSSLGNMAKEMKEIANAGVPAASKKLVDEAAANAIRWLETNQDARIDEINAWKKQLETIKIQVRFDALNSLENMACDMKALVQDAGISAASKKSVEEAVDSAVKWLQTNEDARIDEITAWKKQLEAVKFQFMRYVALNSLQAMACEIKEMAANAGVSAVSKKSMDEAADNAIIWLQTNQQHAEIDQINERKKQLETMKTQMTSDALNSLQKMAYEIKAVANEQRNFALEAAADKTIEWLTTCHLKRPGFNEINDWKTYLEATLNQHTAHN